MSAGVLVVFAKAPLPGRVKTRLSPPLTLEQAAGLYAAMLADVLEASAEFARRLDLAAVLAVDPGDACRVLAREAPRGFCVVAQRGSDLPRRLGWSAREWAASGARRILMRGSDSPLLDGEQVSDALSALEQADVALCPDRDGGYSLIGLRRPVAGLFDHAMSNSDVMRDTLSNARDAGLRTHTLAGSFDIDRVEDLRALAAARQRGVTDLCSRTLAYLDEQRLWRFAASAGPR